MRAPIAALSLCALLACQTRPGATKKNPTDGQLYSWVPPGAFMMGCSPGDNGCGDEEKPPHRVTISKGFWMGQTDVTVDAYSQYAKAQGKTVPSGKQQNTGLEINAGGTFPVVGLAWSDAVAYCQWAGSRLPTEAEWEYAARAGTTGITYGKVDDISWYADNAGKQRIDSTTLWNTQQQNYDQQLAANGDGPKPVAQKKPNAWKLYDMLGDELQWTADWYSPTYYQSSPAVDPQGPATGELRGVRGSGWPDVPGGVRVSYRYFFQPANGSALITFRCVAN